MGKCAHCKREWYSVHNGKKVEPTRIPTCPEAEIMVVCVECFDTLSSAQIIALAQAEEKAGRVHDNIPSVDPQMQTVSMTPMEYLLVESDMADWVRYMKGETSEPPFDQKAFAMS